MTKANELFPNNDQPRPSGSRPSRHVRDILASMAAILFFTCLLLTRLRDDWHINWWICALPAVLSVAFALWALTYNGNYKNDANRSNKAIHTAMARAGIDIQQAIYLGQQPSLYMRECKPNLHRILFESGADINDRDLEWGRTPLMWASERCTNPEVIDALLAAGANVHLRDRFRRTALHCAMFNTNS